MVDSFERDKSTKTKSRSVDLVIVIVTSKRDLLLAATHA